MSSDLPSPALALAAPVELCYALRGLTSRDALVFKSMVRLLAGKTRNRWTCVESDQADLLVVAGDVPFQALRRSDVIRPSTQVIRIEHAGRKPRAEGLVLPLRADDVCLQLDRAGERIAAMPPRSSRAVFRLQLTRWPSALLLHLNPQYIRLATVLGTRPTTMDELAAKSGCEQAECEAFAAVMHGNGVARWLIEAAPKLMPLQEDLPRDENAASLLSRIRASLKL